MAHEVSMEELADVAAWLTSKVDATAPNAG